MNYEKNIPSEIWMVWTLSHWAASLERLGAKELLHSCASLFCVMCSFIEKGSKVPGLGNIWWESLVDSQILSFPLPNKWELRNGFRVCLQKDWFFYLKHLFSYYSLPTSRFFFFNPNVYFPWIKLCYSPRYLLTHGVWAEVLCESWRKLPNRRRCLYSIFPLPGRCDGWCVSCHCGIWVR